jgi:hypothetical protein
MTEAPTGRQIVDFQVEMKIRDHYAMRPAVTCAVVILFACTSAANPGIPPTGESSDAVASTDRFVVASTDRFAFSSDLRVNLHHFLYEWARADLEMPTSRPLLPERADVHGLDDHELAAWRQAVDYYKDTVVTRHASPERLRHYLDQIARPDLASTSIAEVLQAAMPVYQKWWWAEHHRLNRAWAEAVATILRRHEAAFVSFTESVFGAQWPDEPWVIDVVTYSPLLGYATRSGRIVINTAAPENQGLYGVELLLHELQHTERISTELGNALTRAAGSMLQALPPEAGHALIYATAGEFTHRIAVKEGAPEHTPFWIVQDFERMPEWKLFGPAIRRHWLPVLRGEASMESGLREYVGALAH